MRSIASLNDTGLSRDAFAEAIRPLFEAAAPLAEALYAARPFASYAAVIDRAEALANAMPRDQQLLVLSAHPRIGADPAAVSALSYHEQGYATESGGDAEALRQTYARLEALNRQYEQRFGFRFVVFVNRRPKTEIVEVLESRLRNSEQVERATGLREMFLIARDRLASLSATTLASADRPPSPPTASHPTEGTWSDTRA